MRILEDLHLIRQQSALAKIIQEEPETETWPNQEYDEHGIGRELRNLESRKHMEVMGYQERHTKRQEKWAIKP